MLFDNVIKTEGIFEVHIFSAFIEPIMSFVNFPRKESVHHKKRNYTVQCSGIIQNKSI